MIQQQTVIGGLERHEVLDELLMGHQLELTVTQFVGLGFDITDSSVILGVTELFSFGDFGVEIGVV